MKNLAWAGVMLLVLGGASWGAVGDVWNAKTDWSDTSNPKVVAGPRGGTWSYCNPNGSLMLATVTGVGGSPGGWSIDGTANNIGNLFDDLWSSAQDANEFGGHGPWMVRWTSPVSGTVEVSGTLLQLFEPTRRMKAVLQQNGGAFATLLAPEDGGGNTIIAHPDGNPGGTSSRAGLVTFGPYVVTVQAGDRIDYAAIAAGAAEGGNDTPTFVVASFKIKQAEPPPPPLPLAHLAGDVNRDDCVNLEDMAALSTWWLEMGCATPRWCEGSDIDRSGAVDLGDFDYLSRDWNRCYVELRHLGYVVISPYGPTDGGDFGNNTPGTHTGGWQEALNFAVAHQKDVFVVGGVMIYGVAGPVIYWASTTIYVPAAEHLRVVGGDYVINWSTGAAHCMVFDSQRNSSFKLGVLVAQGPGIQNGYAVMRIRPTTALSDGYVGMKNCQFSVSCPVGGGNVYGGGYQGRGTGVELDGTYGPIEHNRFYFMEFNACNIGMHFKAGEIRNNWIISPFTHICNNLLLMETGRYNRIEAWLEPGGAGGTVLGANLQGGEQNLLRLDYPSGMGGGMGVIFGASARDNLVYAKGLAADGIANNSTAGTNQVIMNGPVGYAVGTPAVAASGDVLQVRAPYRIVATITDPGNVQYWASWDADQQGPLIDGPLYRGQVIYLQPGDYVGFAYTAPPSWKWRALRME